MWIGRKPDGSVYGVFSVRQPDDADHPRMEEVADNHPDVVAFLAPKVTQKDPGEQFLDALRSSPGRLNAIKAQLGLTP